LGRWSHRHLWVIISNTYIPGYKVTSFCGEAVDEIMRLTAGMTSVLLQCPGCGDLKTTCLAGDMREAVETIKKGQV
jgi:hypothetical protein